ncbi:MAG: hypothetical protein U5L74_00620 [Ideonella sp.]|nr:hypothetical protein [Ideonella sp.]
MSISTSGSGLLTHRHADGDTVTLPMSGSVVFWASLGARAHADEHFDRAPWNPSTGRRQPTAAHRDATSTFAGLSVELFLAVAARHLQGGGAVVHVDLLPKAPAFVGA